MTKSTEGLKIQTLEVVNFKGILNKVIHINGHSFRISGKNGAYKSSLIQAILSPLDPKSIPDEPITIGQEKASVKMRIKGIINGDEQEYIVKIAFTIKNKKGTVTLYDKDGNPEKSNKTIIDSIVGNISFDTFKFLRDKKEVQIKYLKQLSGCADAVDAISIEIKQVEEERKTLKSRVSEDETMMNNHGFTQDEIDKYAEPISKENMVILQSNVDDIGKSIETYNTIKNKMVFFKESILSYDNKNIEYKEHIDDSVKEIELLTEKIKKEKEKIETETKNIENTKKIIEDYQAKIKLGDSWFTIKDEDGKLIHPEPNIKDASKALSDAVEHNQNNVKINALIEKQKKLVTDKNKIISFTEKITKLGQNKIDVMSKSKLPIKGLTYTDEEIFYNGLPFNEEQINTATFYAIGEQISMALNPNLRVLLRRAGSLIDTDTRKAMDKAAHDKGYMVIEEVVTDEPDMQITFTEE